MPSKRAITSAEVLVENGTTSVTVRLGKLPLGVCASTLDVHAIQRAISQISKADVLRDMRSVHLDLGASNHLTPALSLGFDEVPKLLRAAIRHIDGLG